SCGPGRECSLTVTEPSGAVLRITAAIETTRQSTVLRYGRGSTSVAPPCLHISSRTCASLQSGAQSYASRPDSESGTHSTSKAHTSLSTSLSIVAVGNEEEPSRVNTQRCHYLRALRTVSNPFVVSS